MRMDRGRFVLSGWRRDGRKRPLKQIYVVVLVPLSAYRMPIGYYELM